MIAVVDKQIRIVLISSLGHTSSEPLTWIWICLWSFGPGVGSGVGLVRSRPRHLGPGVGSGVGLGVSFGVRFRSTRKNAAPEDKEPHKVCIVME